MCGFRLRRSFALTRRCDIPAYGIVNSAPARCCVWPVAAPAQAWVRAGAGGGAMCSCCGDGGVSLRVAFCVRSRLPCGSVGMFCVRFTPTIRFYWEVLRSFMPVIRSYWSVLRSFTPVIRSYWSVLRSITPVSFPLSGKERRLAGCCVPIPPWVGIAISAFSYVVRLSDLFGSLRACAFLCGDPD